MEGGGDGDGGKGCAPDGQDGSEAVGDEGEGGVIEIGNIDGKDSE